MSNSIGREHPSFKDRAGETHVTNQGYIVKIVEYIGDKNITVMFDNGFTIKKVRYSNLKKGGVAYPYHPSVSGVGCLGEGVFKSRIIKAYTPHYLKWQDMLFRCYGKCDVSCYSDCTVDERWHNFQNFAKWFEDNYSPENMKSWAIDKDILVKGNKVYSPETCCFVPQEINNLLVNKKNNRGLYPLGVRKVDKKFEARFNSKSLGRFLTSEEAFDAHKIAKEVKIKQVADKWRYLITEKVYEALCNYNVEITD